ncbi:MAG: carboxypeptidase-like regulatory domain-containing protein, partial [Candidatus Altarchaeum sp.]|nr:carboxypeptidase-like regulatory domain-containing protein [Candidatus Altarchaeum sp.]
MEKKVKNTLIFTGITLILFFGMIGLVYADEGKCSELSNYVNHTYFIHAEKENNFVEFDISASEQIVPIYIYIDKPFVQQMFVINLTQKDNDGRYFDHVKLNLKDIAVSEIYLNMPGIHTLLITTDAHYYREDISNLCMPQNPYSFSWDDISENNVEFMKFLKDKLKINWAENAKIKKNDNEISVTNGENSLKLNKKENLVTLKITGGETYKYILKEENNKLNLYDYPCNVLSHPCEKSDRILEYIKVISKDKHDYGIIYKFTGLQDINEKVSYFEKPIEIGNFTKEYNWKLFLLSNSSAVNNENTKKLIENATKVEKVFTSAVVVEGTVYDKDANPVKGAEVGVYIVGIEANVIHIITITDEEGKFKIYHEPAGKYIYRLPVIYIYDPDANIAYTYYKLTDSVNMSAPLKKYSEAKEYPFPVTETLIIGLIIGGILVLFGIGYIDKIINAITEKKK